MGTGMLVLNKPLTDTEVQRIWDEITRREFFIGAAALGTLLVGCSTPEDAGPTQTSGPWSFTDDRGNEVTLSSKPQRFAAFSTAAAALGEFGLTPDAIFGWSDPTTDEQLRFVDLTGAEVVGTAYAEFNLEKLLVVSPELIVGVYDSGDGTLYDFKNKKQEEQVGEIAPIVALDARAPLLDQIAGWRELARSLGADLEAGSVRAGRDRFEAASAALKTALADKPGLKVMAVAPQPDAMNVVAPYTQSDLTYYESLGMEFVDQDVNEFDVDTLSYENLDKYDADVILIDARGAAEEFNQSLTGQPTWKVLPAVEAGQVGGWHIFDPPGYRFYSEAMEELTPLIERSQIIT